MGREADVCPVYEQSIARTFQYLAAIGFPTDLVTEPGKHPESSRIDEPEILYPLTIAIVVDTQPNLEDTLCFVEF
jgi:hypothetical protein